jgi:hypothetical protein
MGYEKQTRPGKVRTVEAQSDLSLSSGRALRITSTSRRTLRLLEYIVSTFVTKDQPFKCRSNEDTT